MGNNLLVSSDIAVSGMKAQAERLRIISQNMANADSTAQTPGGEPYRRQIVTFKDYVDAETGAHKVKVASVQTDESELPKKYDPNHPAADAQGYITLPNVNPLVEMMDMKEAQRSYDANLSMMKTARDMEAKVLDVLK
ncbi:MAG: flagellar basal body rod protein FlgC [Alphaproteobacteria bacterium]|nr:flagellar basal body rod protein FlgC [Alphaproteobacteria bacterium]